MNATTADVHAKLSELTADGQFFELADVVLSGRSYKAYKHAPATLTEVLQSSRNHGDMDFIVYEGQRFSYTEFYSQVDALASALQTEYKVAKGDRVAIAMRNNPQWCISFVAAVMIGAIVVPINSWGKTEELVYAIRDCGAKVLVADTQRFELIADEYDSLNIVGIVPAEKPPAGAIAFDGLVQQFSGQAFEVDEPEPEDLCLVLYTSGSTGFPKGVAHRQISIAQSLMNMMFLGYLVMSVEGQRELRGGAERETPMLTVPLFHGTGLLSGLLLPLQLGQKVVLMYKWDTDQALQLIQDERITSLSSVPAILQALFSAPNYDSFNTQSLMRVTAAGAATPAGLPKLIEQKVPNPSRSAGWAMTETMAVGSTMSGALYDMAPTSAGLKSPINELRFMDDNGNEVAAGEPGEIEIYGVCVTQGYWEKPEANAEVFNDGWLKTGDIGKIGDDGFVYITGRKKEIVIRGGENIYPGEIEDVAYRIDGLQENVVFGVPDETMGEEMVLVAYAPETVNLSTEQIRSSLSEALAAYKVPKHIVVRNEPLPKNASGKLFKKKLRDEYIDAMA